MKKQVGTLTDQLLIIIAHGGDDGLDGLFTYLLGNFCRTLLHALGDVGFLRVAVAALLNNII